MSEFADKVRSVAAPRRLGQAKKVPVIDERDGGVGGYHTLHWDGRQDATVVQREPIRLKIGNG